MEIAIGLFTALGTAGTAAAGTAATAATAGAAAGATTALTAAGTASSALSVLQGVATVGSLLATGIGGLSAYGEAKTQAKLSEVQAESERLAGEEKSLRIRRDLVQKVGANRVAFAASGATIGSGADIEASLEGDAAFETNIEKQNARVRELGARLKADRYNAQATSSLISTAGKMAGIGANYGIDIAKRGV